jgi:phosphomannomutase
MITINPGIFKSYDIRGVYPTEINEENIPVIAKSIYSYISQKLGKKKVTVVTGRDMRLSGPSLYPLLKQALVDLGAEVIDIDLASTPTFYFSVFHYGYDAGIQLSASHNPKEYNGMKMVINTPTGLIKLGKGTGMEEIKELALAQNFQDSSEKGSITVKSGILEDEIENAKKIVDITQIGKLKVVVDAANAMGSQYFDALFAHLPCELIRMNFELDGSFPVHQPNPMIPANIVDLQKKVVQENADIGFAPDGDADRMFVVDEKGNVVPPSIITSIIAKVLLKKNPGAKIIEDLKYILTVKKTVEDNGGEFLISKTGHAFITKLMTEKGGLFAGEASAHYYYKSTGNAESQLITIAILLDVLSTENKKLSELANEYRLSYESGEINFVAENSGEIIEKIKTHFNDGNISTLDGVTIDFPDWRVSLRNSNTEPLLRLNIESYQQETMESKKNEIINIILNSGAKPASEH